MSKVTLSEGDEDFLAVFKKMVRYREERDKIEAETRKTTIEECAKFCDDTAKYCKESDTKMPDDYRQGGIVLLEGLAEQIRMLGENNE